MARTKLKEGDVITLPISNKYVVGLITRIDENKIPLGYLYGHLTDTRYTDIGQVRIDFNKPVFIGRFGFQGFKDNSWQIIGNLPNFLRSDFPVPVFFRHTLPFKPVLVYFDDDMNEIRRQAIEETEIDRYKDYPRTGLSGSGAVEIMLKKLLIDDNTQFS